MSKAIGASARVLFFPGLAAATSRLFTGLAIAAAALTITVVPLRASSFTIVPTFDSTITSLPTAEKNSVESTINTVIGVYEATFRDPVTVNITFANMTSGLGQSTFDLNTVAYSSFISALWANDTASGDTAALANLSRSATVNPVTGISSMFVKSADLKTLGLSADIAVPTDPDGTVSVNLSQTNVVGGSYSLTAVLEHEIDEVLGLGSSLDLQSNYPGYINYISPEDLFRYSASGARSYTDSSAVNAYFSLNGTTDLAQFNNPKYSTCTTNCGDYGDWASGTGKVQVQDAFGTPGATPALGVEIQALDAVGYNPVSLSAGSSQSATPEPSTGLLLGLGLAAVGCAARMLTGFTR